MKVFSLIATLGALVLTFCLLSVSAKKKGPLVTNKVIMHVSLES